MSTQVDTKKKAAKSKQAQQNVKKSTHQRRAEPRVGKVKAHSSVRAEAGVAGGEATAKVSYEAAELAFRAAKPEIDAVSLVGRSRITVSVPGAAEIGLGAVPNVEAKKDEIKKLWPQYDPMRAGRLREYALAALFAHLRAARSAEGETRLRALLDEAAPLRERMLRVAEMHAYCGDLDAERVADIRRGTGHRDTALDLIQLAMLFREARAALAGRTPVTEADIARAAELGSQLVDALGQRRLGSDGAAVPAQEEEDRAKAFWLFYDTYEESRRGMSHLRWNEGDVDQLVPSLFSQIGRRRGAPSAGKEGEEPVEPADPSEGD